MDTPTPRETSLLALTEIHVDPDVNPRVHPNEHTIAEYRALYQDGGDTVLPPLEVFAIGDRYVVADGHHRLEAAWQAGLTHLPCYVSTGTLEEAFLYAVEANKANPLPFTTTDRDRIVKRFLANPQTRRLSVRELARMAGVGRDFVHRRKKEHDARMAVEAAIRRGVGDTSPQVIENTLSDSDSMPPLSPIEERRGLARLLGLAPGNVLEFERTAGPVKAQLIEEVEGGKSLADAVSLVRQDMTQSLTAWAQPLTISAPLSLVLAPAAAPPAPAPAAAPPAPAPEPEPSPTAVTWSNKVHAAMLDRVFGAEPHPLVRVDALIVDALLADPALLEAASPDDVAAALALALRQASKELEDWQDRIDAAMEVVANFNQGSTLAKVQSTLTARLMQEARDTARAMGRMAAQLFWIVNIVLYPSGVMACTVALYGDVVTLMPPSWSFSKASES